MMESLASSCLTIFDQNPIAQASQKLEAIVIQEEGIEKRLGTPEEDSLLILKTLYKGFEDVHKMFKAALEKHEKSRLQSFINHTVEKKLLNLLTEAHQTATYGTNTELHRSSKRAETKKICL